MFFFIRFRSPGSSKWMAVRENGKILVFNRKEDTKKYLEGSSFFQVIEMDVHPANKNSRIYGKEYQKVKW